MTLTSTDSTDKNDVTGPELVLFEGSVKLSVRSNFFASGFHLKALF